MVLDFAAWKLRQDADALRLALEAEEEASEAGDGWGVGGAGVGVCHSWVKDGTRLSLGNLCRSGSRTSQPQTNRPRPQNKQNKEAERVVFFWSCPFPAPATGRIDPGVILYTVFEKSRRDQG